MELTIKHANREITSENVLCWAKRVETQRAQSAIMNCLTEAKEFDKLKIVKNTCKDGPRRSSTQTKMPPKQTCRYCGSSHPPKQCQAHWKKCTECSKICHFRRVCRSRRARSMNEVKQETVQDSTEENSIDLVNINSIHFNKNHLVIKKLKMSAGINNVIVTYKVDTGSNGNIMPLHIYKKLFLRIICKQFAATKMRLYNEKHITKQQYFN